MKIIKNSPDRNAYRVIAGEMLNFETRTWKYVDGEPREVLLNEHKKYPVYNTGNATYNIAVASATIYVPMSTDVEKFIGIIDEVVNGLDPSVAAPEISLYVGNGSYMKAGCTNRVLYQSDADLVKKTRITGGRSFKWKVVTVNAANLTAHPADTTNLIGIFWDANDTLFEPHNTLSFTFSRASFIGYKRKVHGTVKIFTKGDPLAVELNDYWNHYGGVGELRDVNREKIIEVDENHVFVIPVKLSDENKHTHSTSVCSRCKKSLYGEYYGLYNSGLDTDVTQTGKYRVTPICALCLHNSSDNFPIDRRYQRIFRLKSNRTAADMIAMNPERQTNDILIEMTKSLSFHVVNGKPDISFCLIGDKYAGFSSRAEYMYTGIASHPALQGRQFCKVLLVGKAA